MLKRCFKIEYSASLPPRLGFRFSPPSSHVVMLLLLLLLLLLMMMTRMMLLLLLAAAAAAHGAQSTINFREGMST